MSLHSSADTVRRAACLPAVLAVLAACLPGATAATAATPIFPYTAHVTRLDNGLRVIVVPMPAGGLVAYWSIVRTGSRDEFEPGHTGFAHFFEHMMFRGSEKYPRDARDRIVTAMGADANAFTSDDLTGYYLNVAAADLEKVIDLESDRFKNLQYAEADFKTEAGAVYGEYRKNRSSPFFTLSEALQQAAFDVHTYGHTAMGYEADIKAMPTMYDYSRSFFSRYYRPENVVLLITGDVDVDKTTALVRQYYDDWKPGYVAPQVRPEPEQVASKHIDVAYDGQTLPMLWLAYKVEAFDPANTRMVAAELLAALAFGETSAIHKKLVLDEQVVEFIDAEVNRNRDPGLLDIIARVKDPARVDYVLEQIDSTIAVVRDHAPDAARLADLKSRLRYEFLMGLDTPMNVARALARIIAITGGMEAVETLYQAYDRVTAADVQAAAQRYLDPNRRTVAILRGGQR